MKAVITVSSTSGDTEQWMDRMMKINPSKKLNNVGSQMAHAASNATPKESGETASGWKHEVQKTSNGWVLYLINDAHPEVPGNLAMMLDRGHGTRNGGYVAGRHYIKPSVHAGILQFEAINWMNGGKW